MPDKLGYGMDFGTTNSIIAECNPGLRDQRGLRCFSDKTDGNQNRPIPSVVWYRVEESPIVGFTAKQNLHKYLEQPGHAFEKSIKLRLGRPYGNVVIGQRRTASDIAGDIMRSLSAAARRDYQAEVREIVVTIPVKMPGKARRDLQAAARGANLFIKTFVHEPFAAVVGFLYSREPEQFRALEGKNIVVFDWGGGTLDITVARLEKGVLRELSTGALDVGLAGDHFDELLMRSAERRLAEKHNCPIEDVSPLPAGADRFLYECEKAKIGLSHQLKDTIAVTRACLLRGTPENINQDVTRAQFESLIQPIVEQAIGKLRGALSEAHVSEQAVDLALLIGGSCRIPYVRQQVQAVLPAHAVRDVDNADTIIAEGAAVVSAFDLKPVLAHPVGIRLSNGSFYSVFPAGHVLSHAECRKQVNLFCTDPRDGQGKLILAEGHNGTVNDIAVLPIPVSAALPAPYKHERVTVDFLLDDDLVLQIAGRGLTQAQESRCEHAEIRFGLDIRGVMQ